MVPKIEKKYEHNGFQRFSGITDMKDANCPKRLQRCDIEKIEQLFFLENNGWIMIFPWMIFLNWNVLRNNVLKISWSWMNFNEWVVHLGNQKFASFSGEHE